MNKLIISNFKSNKSIAETLAWINKFNQIPDSLLASYEVSVAPSFVSLESAAKAIENSGKKYSLAVQDISPFPSGSYTGAISVQNLLNIKIRYAIIGHSERRKYFHETSQDVAMKVEQSLLNGILPIVCIDDSYLEEQLNMISKENLSKCIIAFEPASAIGTGSNADLGVVKGVIQRVRKIAGDIKVIYGGSVDDQNINEYLLVTDGVLISSFSLDASNFMRAIKTIS